MISILLLTFFVALSLGWASRMDGGGPPVTPEWFERTFVMIPTLALAGTMGFAPVLFSALGVVGRITGHGMYFLQRMPKAIEPEFFDFVVRRFFGADPRAAAEFADLRGIDMEDMPEGRADEIMQAVNAYGWDRLYWRCVTGMAVTGLVVTLPLALVTLAHGHALAAVIIAIAGAQKGLAYMIGYHANVKGWNKDFPMYLSGDTEIGEFLNGCFMALLLALAYGVM